MQRRDHLSAVHGDRVTVYGAGGRMPEVGQHLLDGGEEEAVQKVTKLSIFARNVPTDFRPRWPADVAIPNRLR